jgi:hypothetical protein
VGGHVEKARLFRPAGDFEKAFDNIEVLQLAISMTEKWRLYQQAKLRLDDLEKWCRSAPRRCKRPTGTGHGQ